MLYYCDYDRKIVCTFLYAYTVQFYYFMRCFVIVIRMPANSIRISFALRTSYKLILLHISLYLCYPRPGSSYFSLFPPPPPLSLPPTLSLSFCSLKFYTRIDPVEYYDRNYENITMQRMLFMGNCASMRSRVCIVAQCERGEWYT